MQGGGRAARWIIYCLLWTCSASCNKEPVRGGAAARRDAAATKPTSGEDATIEVQIALGDVAISIVGWRDSSELPTTIRVRYENKSVKRGYFELPSPVRGQLHSEYAIPSLAVGLEPIGDVLADGGGIFLFAPREAEQPERRRVALLDPGAGVTEEYATVSFCMIGHGIAPDPEANLESIYKAGNNKLELRVHLITDWNKMSKVSSEAVSVKLSKPDRSKHQEFREATKHVDDDEVDGPAEAPN